MKLEYELTDCLTAGGRQIRTEVFMEEQGFRGEFDSIDGAALHVTCYADQEPAATGRTFPREGEPGAYTIGRVAVRRPWRKQGLGAAVIQRLEQAARERGAREVALLAQVQAKGFYEKLGYRAVGPVVYDEHCPHVSMRKPLEG